MHDKEGMAYSRGIAIGFMFGGIIACLACFVIYISTLPDDEISCRDGKAYLVTHDGNITIYDPTYSDCETGGGK